MFTLETKPAKLNIKSCDCCSSTAPSVEPTIINNNTTIIYNKGHVYPRVRWARNGRIDLDNLNGIDYVVVPCFLKRQLLYITNKELKSYSTTASIASLLGHSLLDFESYEEISQFAKTIPYNTTIKSCFRRVNLWLHDSESVLDLDIELPFDKGFAEFIYIKQFCWNKKALWFNPEIFNCDMAYSCPTVFNRSTRFGHKQFFYLTYKHISWFALFGTKKASEIDDSEYRAHIQWILLNANHQHVTKVPYAVIVNPFKGKFGGAIPVKDGKLLLDKAFVIKNKTFWLDSALSTLSFDNEGQCKDVLTPSKKEVFPGMRTNRRTYHPALKKHIIDKEFVDDLLLNGTRIEVIYIDQLHSHYPQSEHCLRIDKDDYVRALAAALWSRYPAASIGGMINDTIEVLHLYCNGDNPKVYWYYTLDLRKHEIKKDGKGYIGFLPNRRYIHALNAIKFAGRTYNNHLRPFKHRHSIYILLNRIFHNFDKPYGYYLSKGWQKMHNLYIGYHDTFSTYHCNKYSPIKRMRITSLRGTHGEYVLLRQI